MVPDGSWGSALAVVDSCNYRLQIISPHDGKFLRTVGRPGARFAELSSPSSIAHDPRRNGCHRQALLAPMQHAHG